MVSTESHTGVINYSVDRRQFVNLRLQIKIGYRVCLRIIRQPVYIQRSRERGSTYLSIYLPKLNSVRKFTSQKIWGRNLVFSRQTLCRKYVILRNLQPDYAPDYVGKEWTRGTDYSAPNEAIVGLELCNHTGNICRLF